MATDDLRNQVNPHIVSGQDVHHVLVPHLTFLPSDERCVVGINTTSLLTVDAPKGMVGISLQWGTMYLCGLMMIHVHYSAKIGINIDTSKEVTKKSSTFALLVCRRL